MALKCPKCDGVLRCRDTRTHEERNEMTQLRQCTKCGRWYRTIIGVGEPIKRGRQDE